MIQAQQAFVGMNLSCSSTVRVCFAQGSSRQGAIKPAISVSRNDRTNSLLIISGELDTPA